MNEELQRGRQKYQELRRESKIPTVKMLNPIEAAKANPKSRKKAIAAKCYDCCGNNRQEVTLCEIADCPLWALRPWQRK